jgi:hypothetical protein
MTPTLKKTKSRDSVRSNEAPSGSQAKPVMAGHDQVEGKELMSTNALHGGVPVIA